MELLPIKDLPKIPSLKLAVVGHVEWVTFLSVDKYPKAGCISHGEIYREEPAGGGAVAAVQMSKLTEEKVHFYTALGKDGVGEMSYHRLKQLGLEVNVAWREEPTRKGISFIDSNGERAITVIGNRLQPSSNDQLRWDELTNYDGVFVTAVDSGGLNHCRKAALLVASPRIGIETFKRANINIDALIGSALDPDERTLLEAIKPSPRICIATQGSLGGEAFPGGQFKAFKLKKAAIDAYGCGDSFAAGVTIGLSSGWSLNEAISLGAHCGAQCSTLLGPYED